jgi:hypothetical protein
MGTTTSLNPASVKEVTEASQHSTSYGTSRNFGDSSGPANARVAVCIPVQIMNLILLCFRKSKVIYSGRKVVDSYTVVYPEPAH